MCGQFCFYMVLFPFLLFLMLGIVQVLAAQQWKNKISAFTKLLFQLGLGGELENTQIYVRRGLSKQVKVGAISIGWLGKSSMMRWHLSRALNEIKEQEVSICGENTPGDRRWKCVWLFGSLRKNKESEAAELERRWVRMIADTIAKITRDQEMENSRLQFFSESDGIPLELPTENTI